MTVFVRFSDELPERTEIRIIVLVDGPSGREIERLYFDEHFCADPDCDCQRVMLRVHNSRRDIRATIMYDFLGDAARTPDGENPYLEPAVKQSDGAVQILARVRDEILADAAYRARLVSHYDEMKARLRNPEHPLWPAILQDRVRMSRMADALVGVLTRPGQERRERNRAKRLRKKLR